MSSLLRSYIWTISRHLLIKTPALMSGKHWRKVFQYVSTINELVDGRIWARTCRGVRRGADGAVCHWPMTAPWCGRPNYQTTHLFWQNDSQPLQIHALYPRGNSIRLTQTHSHTQGQSKTVHLLINMDGCIKNEKQSFSVWQYGEPIRRNSKSRSFKWLFMGREYLDWSLS